MPLVRPLQSTIREHCTNVCNVDVKSRDFEIITTSRNEQELRILESILIRLRRPSLNRDDSSFPLYIL